MDGLCSPIIFESPNWIMVSDLVYLERFKTVVCHIVGSVCHNARPAPRRETGCKVWCRMFRSEIDSEIESELQMRRLRSLLEKEVADRTGPKVLFLNHQDLVESEKDVENLSSKIPSDRPTDDKTAEPAAKFNAPQFASQIKLSSEEEEEESSNQGYADEEFEADADRQQSYEDEEFEVDAEPASLHGKMSTNIVNEKLHRDSQIISSADNEENDQFYETEFDQVSETAAYEGEAFEAEDREHSKSSEGRMLNKVANGSHYSHFPIELSYESTKDSRNLSAIQVPTESQASILQSRWENERRLRLASRFPERAELERNNPFSSNGIAAAIRSITEGTRAAVDAFSQATDSVDIRSRADWMHDQQRSEWGVGEQGDWLDGHGHRGPSEAHFHLAFSGGGFTDVLVDGLEWSTSPHELLRAFRAVGPVAASRLLHHEVCQHAYFGRTLLD